jgi:hypothetical protein
VVVVVARLANGPVVGRNALFDQGLVEVFPLLSR